MHVEHKPSCSIQSSFRNCHLVFTPMAILDQFLRSTKLFFFLLMLLLLLLFVSKAEAQRRQETTNISFYLQDVATGPNATVVPVTGISGKNWSFTTFGTIFVIDDPLTQTPERNSNKVGRAQGMLVASALDASNVHVMLSIVFTSADYNGSTLELQGISRQFDRYKEISVVSGTGTFRFARGYAIFETIYYDNRISYSIIRCTVSLIRSP